MTCTMCKGQRRILFAMLYVTCHRCLGSGIEPQMQKSEKKEAVS